MSHDEIAQATIPEMKELLDDANYYSTHPITDSVGASLTGIDGLDKSVKSVQHLLDFAKVAKANGWDTKTFNEEAAQRSQEAAFRDAHSGQWWNPLQAGGNIAAAYHDWKSAYSPVNRFVDDAANETKNLAAYINQTSGVQRRAEQGKGESASITGGYGPLYGTLKIPESAGQAIGIKNVDRLFQGAPIDEVIKGLEDEKAKLVSGLQDATKNANLNGVRVPKKYRDDAQISADQVIPDRTNPFRDKKTVEFINKSPYPNSYTERLPSADLFSGIVPHPWLGQTHEQAAVAAARARHDATHPQTSTTPSPSQSPTKPNTITQAQADAAPKLDNPEQINKQKSGTVYYDNRDKQWHRRP
jgi:hypothetical protein